MWGVWKQFSEPGTTLMPESWICALAGKTDQNKKSQANLWRFSSLEDEGPKSDLHLDAALVQNQN